MALQSIEDRLPKDATITLKNGRPKAVFDVHSYDFCNFSIKRNYLRMVPSPEYGFGKNDPYDHLGDKCMFYEVDRFGNRNGGIIIAQIDGVQPSLLDTSVSVFLKKIIVVKD